MNKRVVITGLGVVSSIGIGWEKFWDALLKGKSGISPVSSFDTSSHFTHNGGEVRDFRPEDFIPKEKLPTLSRASQMALAAAKLAVGDSRLAPDKLSGIKAGVCIGATSGSGQVIEQINDRLMQHEEVGTDLICRFTVQSTPAVIAREFALKGANMIFSTACAAGNYAVGYGYDLIRAGSAEVVLAGASDAFSRISFTGFNQFSAVAPEKCQPFDKSRKGMMVAEGAAILVLESLAAAKERNASIYAELIGYGLSCDAHHMTTSSVEGIAVCMQKALQEAGCSTDDVDYISAHGTGTAANDKNECAAIRQVFGLRSKSIPISSIKSMLGHTMGAASALETIVCALAVKHDRIPPTINYETHDPDCDIDCVPNQARHHPVTIALNNSYAFGGNNASIVLKKFNHEKGI